mmetsp:Transcript_46665/g.51994  ORF Transcript_46665/g.51994 Transcript_46665/m.51994 type:complete len:88 (+) Transcript_46665:161-424(+)
MVLSCIVSYAECLETGFGNYQSIKSIDNIICVPSCFLFNQYNRVIVSYRNEKEGSTVYSLFTVCDRSALSYSFTAVLSPMMMYETTQ